MSLSEFVIVPSNEKSSSSLENPVSVSQKKCISQLFHPFGSLSSLPLHTASCTLVFGEQSLACRWGDSLHAKSLKHKHTSGTDSPQRAPKCGNHIPSALQLIKWSIAGRLNGHSLEWRLWKYTLLLGSDSPASKLSLPKSSWAQSGSAWGLWECRAGICYTELQNSLQVTPLVVKKPRVHSAQVLFCICCPFKSLLYLNLWIIHHYKRWFFKNLSLIFCSGSQHCGINGFWAVTPTEKSEPTWVCLSHSPAWW